MLLSLALNVWSQSPDDALKSRAELTNYEETSRYDDVLRFFNQLQQRRPLVRLETFGQTGEGRALPLVILSDPPLTQPREAMESGKPIVFVMANIHAGEVEGKEAVQNLARRIVAGDLRPILKKLIILIAPIYNADGNERISVDHRTAQNGPIGGVGIRENAQGLDLNRDFIKMDAPETRALIRLFNRWDPHLTVDLHTTDGSYHGYHLTYSIPLHPSVDARITGFEREKMMPALTRAMRSRHWFRTYFYGNFPRPTTNAAAAEPRSWRAFTYQPRIGQNYIGFRNRLTILSEAYSYLDFRRRIEVTEAFTEEILKYTAAHGDEIRALTRRVDEDTIQRGLSGTPLQLGVEFEPKALPAPVEILVGEVTKVKNPRSGRDMTAMVEDKFTRVKMPDYGLFAATRTVPAARAYLYRPEENLRVVTEKLLAHGIAVEELTSPLTTEVETFVIDSVRKAARPFEEHNGVKLAGRYKTETITFPAGTILVRTAQPLGTLAACLLEPESDDGLVTWNVLDSYLDSGKTYPIAKAMQNLNAASRLVTVEEFTGKVSVAPNSSSLLRIHQRNGSAPSSSNRAERVIGSLSARGEREMKRASQSQ